MKALAKMARDLAGCANPDQYMPGRIAGANTSALTAFQINIDMGAAAGQGGYSSTTPPVAPPGATLPAPPGAGLSPTEAMPPPVSAAPTGPDAVPPGGMTMGYIFGDTAPAVPTGRAEPTVNPPTRERPNG